MGQKVYKVTIEYAHKDLKELSAKERIMLKDTSDGISLGDLKEDEFVLLKPKAYAMLHIENSEAESGEYNTLVIINEDDKKYTTSSENFFDTFADLMGELVDCEEDYQIKVFTKPSKNFKGKSFLTCTVI